MNDPHVSALHYRVCHNESVDYSEAKPLVFDQPSFRVEVKDRKARFELKQHYASEDEARKLIDPFVKNWEFDASLRRAPGFFRLEFDRAEIIDRSPTKGVLHVSWSIRAGSPTVSVKAQVQPMTYPTAPSQINSDHPDVQTLYQTVRELLPRQGAVNVLRVFLPDHVGAVGWAGEGTPAKGSECVRVRNAGSQ